LKSSWRIECERLAKEKSSVWSLKNKMIIYMGNNFVLPYLFYVVHGFWGAYYFIITAIIAILFLETVNYIEHYGLERKEISPGVYEKVDFTHSWNAPHRLTNYLLFKL
jgi:alkane 1-monooxygenase